MALLQSKKRAWIYCSVSKESLRYLLNHQEKILTDFCEKNKFQIIGVTKEIRKSSTSESWGVAVLESQIRRRNMDYILLYDRTRLLVQEDQFIEFKMLAETHDIKIIELNELADNNKDFES